MIVLDASAVIEILLRPAHHPSLMNRVFDTGHTLAAPHLLDLEVTQVLRRYLAGREITTARADAAFADYNDMRITRFPHIPLLGRIWALRHNCTAYDAAYLVLAETLNCPLLTCDTALTDMPSHRATVEVYLGLDIQKAKNIDPTIE
jgi:predicted nucleic acid-binding protein